MHSLGFLLFFPLSLVSAVNLWVSSYAGTVTTLSLTKNTTSAGVASYSLTNTYTSNECLNNPSWLLFNSTTRILHCIGEGLTSPTGILTTFKAQANGQLTETSQMTTIVGGVNTIQYSAANGSQYLAIAHYVGSALSTWSLHNSTIPTQLQSFKFTLPHPGPNPVRQDAPHPHQVILDPSGRYILSPDLGADLIRVYSINATTGLLASCSNITVTPGSGPRHATFATPLPSSGPSCEAQSALKPAPAAHRSVLYLVSELVNTVTAFNVSYPSTGCLDLEEFKIESSFGPAGGPSAAAVAEIHVANNHLLVSNRGDMTFPATPTSNVSDSLAAFSLTGAGEFDFQQLSPAGGSFPRDFSINKAGDLMAVGLQYSNEVAIFSRSMENGSVQKMVARTFVPQNVTCVVWDE